MIKNYFLLFILLFYLTTISPLKSEEKVTFLNLDAVLNNTILGKTIVSELNELNNENSKNFDLERKKIKKKEQDLINKQNILSKEEFNSQLSILQNEIKNFNKDKNKKILKYEQLKKKELDNFIKKITPLIENYTITNSISLVVNQKNIFIGSKKYDITGDIIELVDNNLK